jgi:hypothetical protein
MRAVLHASAIASIRKGWRISTAAICSIRFSPVASSQERNIAPAGCAESGRGILWRRARQSGCRAPIPRPENLGIRAEYRGGNWPNTRNPAGGADGVWVGSVGGDAAKAREWTAGIGGRAVNSRQPLVARGRKRFRPGGTRYRIRSRAGQALYSPRYAYRSAFH